MNNITFDWVPFYKELADKLLPYRKNRQELIEKVRQIYAITGHIFDYVPWLPLLQELGRQIHDQILDLFPGKFLMIPLFEVDHMPDIKILLTQAPSFLLSSLG